jgi:hypothetical protein
MITIVHGDGVSEVVTVLMFVVVTCLFRAFGELDGVSISITRHIYTHQTITHLVHLVEPKCKDYKSSDAARPRHETFRTDCAFVPERYPF